MQNIPVASLSASSFEVNIHRQTKLHDALQTVHMLRAMQNHHADLKVVVRSVKRVQCRRFERSYTDMLTHSDWAAAARFFLEELYADRDFSLRDAQFERIAPRIEQFFPSSVAAIATLLAQLHALSEQLDHAVAIMISRQIAMNSVALDDLPVCAIDQFSSAHYVHAWRLVGHAEARQSQLQMVLELGRGLARITRMPGLHMMLRLMRKPARGAGLEQLQHFLEHGLEIFSKLQTSSAGVTLFLHHIEQRETAWIARLFETSRDNTETQQLWPELE